MDTAIAMANDKMEAIRRDPDLWYSYYRHERSMREYEHGLENEARRGKQEGIPIGEHNKAVEIARWLKSQNMLLAQIAEGTGLSLDEIAKL
jgi:predicted transposase/invertase (TIGR01784 family)